MNAPVMPGPLHIDGGADDIHRVAASLGPALQVAPAGRRGQQLELSTPRISGRVTSMSLHFGMQVMINQLEGHVPLEFPLIHGPAPLAMSFCRGEGVQAHADDGSVLDFSGGAFNVSRVAKMSHFRYQTEAEARERAVHVSLTPALLQELLGTPDLPRQVQAILEQPSDFALSGHGMNRQMFDLTDEIFELTSDPTWGSSPGRALALEGKVLELLGLAVDQLDGESASSALSNAEMRGLARARELIASRLDSPPTVTELARRVGIGEKRLKKGFKQVFGSPVMSYARRLRLERARALLTSRGHNVTEVAHLVGYSNASKFAAAYRREFGENPGNLRSS